jgi:Notch-like protein
VGEYCQYKNPCTSGGQKCQNGGTCSVIMSSTRGPTFQCVCPIGYTASFCEIAVAANACNDNPCKNGATCSLTSLTNYTCTCPLGWKGEFEFGH